MSGAMGSAAAAGAATGPSSAAAAASSSAATSPSSSAGGKGSDGDVVLVDVYRDESQLDIDMELSYSSQASSILGIRAFGASVANKLTDKVVDLRITSIFNVHIVSITADELTSNSEKVKLSEFFYLKQSDELARMLFLRMVLMRQAHLRYDKVVKDTAKAAKDKDKSKGAKAAKGKDKSKDDKASKAAKGSGGAGGSGGGKGLVEMHARIPPEQWTDFWARVEDVIQHDASLIDEARQYNSLLSILYRWKYWLDTSQLLADETELSGDFASAGHETQHVLRRRWELQKRAQSYWAIIATTYRISLTDPVPDSISLREKYKHVARPKLKQMFLSKEQCDILRTLIAKAHPDYADRIVLPEPKGSEDEMQPPKEFLFGGIGPEAAHTWDGERDEVRVREKAGWWEGVRERERERERERGVGQMEGARAVRGNV